MANEQRLKELAALAQIFAQFQEPQIAQARLAQQAEQGDVNAMLNVLGLIQQRTEAEQRAGEAAARNEVALKQLGLTERQVAGEETERPLRMRKGEEEIRASEVERGLAPRKVEVSERAATTAEVGGQQTRFVDLLQLLAHPQTSPESQALIGGSLQGQPGFESLSRILGTQQEERRRKVEEAKAPALRVLQGQGQLSGAGPAVPTVLPQLPGAPPLIPVGGAGTLGEAARRASGGYQPGAAVPRQIQPGAATKLSALEKRTAKRKQQEK